MKSSGVKKFMSRSVIFMILTVLAGCETTSRHYSSSVVQFLYPEEIEPVESPEIPVLSLPLKVGIAFVPGAEGGGYSSPVYRTATNVLSEKERIDLMRKVGDHFKANDFVKSIEIIPSAYLKQKGSFANLDQIRTMFGVDVVALLSFDQSQFVTEGFSTISYWTVIGAYIVEGQKNDTHTMLDAAVYHIPSRKLMFRAPGLSQIKGTATPVNWAEQSRLDSVAGFQQASKDLIINLDQELEAFKIKMKESPEEFKVVRKPGYTGSGSLDGWFLSLMVLISGYCLWNRRKERD